MEKLMRELDEINTEYEIINKRRLFILKEIEKHEKVQKNNLKRSEFIKAKLGNEKFLNAINDYIWLLKYSDDNEDGITKVGDIFVDVKKLSDDKNSVAECVLAIGEKAISELRDSLENGNQRRQLAAVKRYSRRMKTKESVKILRNFKAN